MNGISSVTDPPRLGQAHRVVTPEAVAGIQAIVKENRRVTANETAAHLDISHGSATISSVIKNNNNNNNKVFT
jgi:hypothetical protein